MRSSITKIPIPAGWIAGALILKGDREEAATRCRSDCNKVGNRRLGLHQKSITKHKKGYYQILHKVLFVMACKQLFKTISKMFVTFDVILPMMFN